MQSGGVCGRHGEMGAGGAVAGRALTFGDGCNSGLCPPCVEAAGCYSTELNER